MSFLKINRLGVVKTNKKTVNQCKALGHEQYNFHVAITCCATNLNKDRFIVDHQEIKTLVQGLFDTKTGSCEDLCVEIANQVKKQFKHIHAVDIYVKLWPVVPLSTDSAFMEYSETGKFNI